MIDQDDNGAPIFSKQGSITFFEFIVVCINSGIGAGVLSLGQAFCAGMIFSLIFSALFSFISYYSMLLFVLAAAQTHESTFEEIWIAGAGKVSAIISLIFSFFLPLTNMAAYFQFLQGSLISLLTNIINLVTPDATDVIESLNEHAFLVGLVIIVVFYIPMCFAENVRMMVTASFISVGCFLILLFYVIIRYFIHLHDVGFDPTHTFKLFDPEEHWVKCISVFCFAYIIYPFVWPGLRHLKNSTLKSYKKAFGILMFSFFILNSTTGIFSYLTYLDKDEKGSILNYYPTDTKTDKVLVLIPQLLVFIYIVLTVPFRLNGCRYMVLNYIHKTDVFPKVSWYSLGVIFSLVGLFIANWTDEITTDIFIGSDILAALNLFFTPSTVYLINCWKNKGIHFWGAIGMEILGVGCCIFMIYYDIIAV